MLPACGRVFDIFAWGCGIYLEKTFFLQIIVFLVIDPNTNLPLKFNRAKAGF